MMLLRYDENEVMVKVFSFLKGSDVCTESLNDKWGPLDTVNGNAIKSYR